MATLGFEDQIWHVARHLGGCEALYHNYIINVDQTLQKCNTLRVILQAVKHFADLLMSAVLARASHSFLRTKFSRSKGESRSF